MNAEMGCEQVREIAPDLAIGIADGQERDAALRHTATCSSCRGMVADLSSTADELLLLAPEHEPPAGFESRTVARLGRRRERRRWELRPLAIAASFALAVAVGAGAVWTTTSGDRRLAESYRQVLSVGQGSFFAAAPLRGPEGSEGTVFGYAGRPSWMFATVDLPTAGPERLEVVLTTLDGRRLSLGSAVLGGSHDTWGARIPVELTAIDQLRFEDGQGRAVLVAYIDANDPWGSG
jgi:hypothetical protein